MYTVLRPKSNHVDQSQNHVNTNTSSEHVGTGVCAALGVLAAEDQSQKLKEERDELKKRLSISISPAYGVWAPCFYDESVFSPYRDGSKPMKLPGWWFGTFFMFPNSWDDFQIFSNLTYSMIFQGGRYTRAQPPSIDFHILRNNNP